MSALAEQLKELGLCHASLPEHLVEEPSRDVPALLVAQPDLENLLGGESFLPGLVLSAPDKLKAGPPQDHPEVTHRKWPSASTIRRGCGLRQLWG